eukprot:TRINITY_DN10676_c1_g2_i1.p1 TRINITY_DN10676_c1_g2~~TRINITY_DN10676_c1_g2_i1.p1  ORF type:complete len:546 (-),score=133.47 TRINITY_DN10676_c1_g2_i1:182-1708(-)
MSALPGGCGGGVIASLMQAASWDADLNANLSSIAILLNEEPLVLLQKESGDAACQFEDCIEDEDELAAEREAAALAAGHAARLAVVLARREGSAGAAPTLALRARLTQEPLRFNLAPQSLRTALETSIALGRTMLSVLTSDASAASSSAAAAAPVPATIPEGEEDEPRGAPGAAAAPAAAAAAAAPAETRSATRALELTLDLDLDVAAPVLRWALLPRGHVTVALGRFLFRSCEGGERVASSTAPAPWLQPPESCPWRSFACVCHLAETSVAVQVDGSSEHWVYDPSTINLRAWREVEDGASDGGSCWQLRVDSEVLRWTADRGALTAAAQLPLSLDYALGPVRRFVGEASAAAAAPAATADGAASSAAGQASVSPAADTTSPGAEADEASKGSAATQNREGVVDKQAAAKVCMQVRIERFELISCLSKAEGTLSLVTEGIEGKYTARTGRVDWHSQVAQFEVSYEASRLCAVPTVCPCASKTRIATSAWGEEPPLSRYAGMRAACER